MNCRALPFAFTQIRKLSSNLKNQKNHYDSLGISKNATQADVKGAYYNLSKIYHPDKNQGNAEQREEHSQKFRDITEAYEVLGNVRTRKMYDKGFFMGNSPHASTATAEDPLHKFYKSRERRSKPPTPDGRTPIYDFDEWAKNHYSQTFQKAQDVKRRRAFEKYVNEDPEKYKVDFMVITTAFLLLFVMYIKESLNYDKVVLKGDPASRKRTKKKDQQNE